MSSPHGVFCESPHGAFIQSPHGVRGCRTLGASSVPFYVLIPTPTQTWLYRIDAGLLVWSTDLSNVLGDGPANGPVRVEWNSHGLFCVFKDNAGGVIIKVDPSTGQKISHTRDLPVLGFANQDGEAWNPPICANRQHLFSVEFILANPQTLGWRRYDTDLNTLDSGTTLIGGTLSGQTAAGRRYINDRVNVIDLSGHPRIGSYSLDPSNLSQLSGSFPVPATGATFKFMGESVLQSRGISIFHTSTQYSDGSIFSPTLQYITSAAEAQLTSPAPGMSPVRGVCIREHNNAAAQFISPQGSYIRATDPFDPILIVDVRLTGSGIWTWDFSPQAQLLWQFNTKPLLPVAPESSSRCIVIRTSGGTIRVVGSTTHMGTSTTFAAEFSNPEGGGALSWYIELDQEPFNQRIQAATAVLGSGEDSVYTPG